MWRRRFALGILALWAIVSLARLTKLVEPPAVPPGQEAQSLFDVLRATIPPTAGYLFVLPGEFGADTGLGPRLRYELYPRTYDDVRASQDEATARAVMTREHLRYVVVPDEMQYPSTHWIRQVPAWLKRTDIAPGSYVLEVAS